MSEIEHILFELGKVIGRLEKNKAHTLTFIAKFRHDLHDVLGHNDAADNSELIRFTKEFLSSNPINQFDNNANIIKEDIKELVNCCERLVEVKNITNP